MVKQKVSDHYPSTKKSPPKSKGAAVQNGRKSPRSVPPRNDHYPEKAKVQSWAAGLSIRQMVDGYLLDCRASRQAPGSIESKRINLMQLVEYAEQQEWPGVESLTPFHLRQYLADIQDRPRWFGEQGDGSPISANYYQTIYRRIKTFFNWLVAEKIIEGNPMDRIARPKFEEKVVATVAAEEFERLIALTDPKLARTERQRFRAYRDQAVLWLLADTSMRREGITGLKVDDVELDERKALVTEKGRKQRYVWFGNTASKALWRYLMEREKLHPTTEALWVDAEGQAMDLEWINSMFKRLGKRCGIDHLHPHRFRHTFAATMSEEGTPTSVLEVMGGWKKIPRTYLSSIGDRAAKEWHQRVSPGDRLARQIRGRK